MAVTTEIPNCPYCGAPWTTSMLHVFDRYSRGISCNCCVVMPGLDLGPAQTELPAQDLCCENCGKPIYSAPVPAASTDAPAPDPRQYRSSSRT